MSPLVVGVGQPDRGDDVLGLLVAEEVRRQAPGCTVMTVTSPTRLIDAWEGWDEVVVVDAVRTGRAPGELTVVEVGDRLLPARPGAGGSHGFGVAEAVELGRSLDRLPRRLVVVGVEAQTFAQGAAMSPAVARAVDRATRAVIDVLPATAHEGGGQ